MAHEPPKQQFASRRAWDWLLRIVVVGAAVAALGRYLRGSDLTRAVALVRSAGWPIVVVLFPTAVAMGFDAQGWRLILRTLGHDAGWRALLRIRFAVESVVLALPAGPVAGEAMKVGLLRRRTGALASTGVASLALTKACLWGSEAIYLAIAGGAVAVGWGSGRLPSATPAMLAVGGAGLMGGLSVLAFSVMREATWASRLAGGLTRIPIERLRRWIEARRAGFAELERTAAAFFRAPTPVRARCLRTFTFEWLVEGVETYIILRFLGVAVGVGDAMAIDSVTSLLRALAFFVPAGLGVQDLSQMILLRQLGVPDAPAVGAALIFIKRTKEVFWVFTGSLFFTGTPRA